MVDENKTDEPEGNIVQDTWMSAFHIPHVLRFQREPDQDGEVWSAFNNGMKVHLFIEENRIAEIHAHGVGINLVPRCEKKPNEDCRCFFEDDDELSGIDCPWATPEVDFQGFTQCQADLDFTKEILIEEVKKVIAETVHPEFGAPESILDVFAFTWIIMDEVNGPRMILKGGQVERPDPEQSH